jgi:hypothetical protein
MNQEDASSRQDDHNVLPPHHYTAEDARQWRLDAMLRLAHSGTVPEEETRPFLEQDSGAVQMAHLMQPTRTRSWTRRLVLPILLALSIVTFLALSPDFPFLPLLSGLAHQVWPAASTATPTLPLSARQLYLEADVPGTAVTLDGHPISLPEIVGSEAPLVLTPGMHQVTWRAPPFPSQSCHLSVPASAADTCERLSSTLTPSGGPVVPLVELGESFVSLSTSQQTALLQATQSTLAHLPATRVQPAEHYLTSTGVGVATTAFDASLTFQLQSEAGTFCQLDPFSTASEPCQLDGQDCARFCSLPWLSQEVVRSAGGPSGWLVLASAFLTWTYRNLDGSGIAANLPLDLGVAAINSHLVMLSVTLDGSGWHVLPVFGDQLGQLPLVDNTKLVADNSACAAAQDLLYALGQQQIGTPGGTVHVAADTDPSDGCLVVMGSLVFLVRFGIVIPVSQAARTFEPAPVPTLTANEQQLVQLLLGLHGQDLPISLG